MLCKQGPLQLHQGQKQQDNQENAINVANQWRALILKPVVYANSNIDNKA